jgi:Secretion system C-terminal sorting domain/Right handed beta helix region
MKKLFLLFLLFVPLLVFAQTNIPAGDVNGTWTLAGSPYNIDGEIQLQAADQLIIEPGVIVSFTGYYKFIINGKLLAEGTGTNSITFTSSAANWHGLRFIDTNANGQDSSKVVYCEFEDGFASGNGSDHQGGAMFVYNSSNLLIDNCYFSDNMATTGGALYFENSDAVIQNTEIFENIATGAGGGIYLNGSDVEINVSKIHFNEAFYDGGGINCFNSEPALDHVEITNNFTEWNGGGISAYNYSNLDLTNVTISENTAYQAGSGIACLYISSVDLMNCILWNNDTYEMHVSSSGTVNVEYTDVQNGEQGIQTNAGATVSWLTGNLSLDPEFLNPIFDDFTLQSISPCIDAGNPDPSFNDPDGSLNDMGAYYFHQAGIKGTVTFTEGSTGNVEEVIIEITGAVNVTTYPNLNGVYFVNLDPGIYTVTASYEGYTANPLYYTDIEVTIGELVTDIDFEMTPPIPGSVMGTVAVIGTGDVESVEISAGDAVTYPYWVSDPGYYEYELVLPSGFWDVTASLEGYQDSTYTNIAVQPSAITPNINFILSPATYLGFIEGTVTVRGGPGQIEDVVVSADTSSTRPDAAGFYHLEVENGTYNVSASLNGYATYTAQNVSVVGGNTMAGIDMTLLPWSIIPGTQYTMTVFVTASLDGKFVTGINNNQLAAFGPGGDSDCRGVATWEEGSHILWDTEYHYWDLPGYWYITITSNNNSGEVIDFKMYETLTDSIYECYESLVFVDDVMASMDQTYPSTVNVMEFDLNVDWNWVSFNLDPITSSTATLFDLLTPNDINQIKNQTQSYTYFPSLGTWVGDLTNISNGDGFLIDMLNPVDPFQFNGELINPTVNPFNLSANYNWIGYYPNSEMPVAEALESIEAQTQLIKNQTQSATYTGAEWVGDLQEMKPGESYKINMIEAAVLTYPGTAGYGASREDTKVIPAGWDLLSGTKGNMISIADIVVNGIEINNAESYTVGVFDENGQCRSVGKCETDFWYFTIVGNEDGEELHFRLIDLNSRDQFASDVRYHYIEDDFLGGFTKPIIIEFDTFVPIAPAFLSLKQNHPNPFNPSTAISYSLPEDGKVELSIYNMKGQLVTTLVNTEQTAGNYSIEWNAENHSSGVYFYKLNFGKETLVKKCIMLK